jgi:hypothetical protein
VFSALAADPEFHLRVLRVGRRTAQAQARVLARTLLFEARAQATRVLLADEEDFAARHRFEELGARLFGAPLDGRFCGAWPLARPDDPASFVALLQVRAMRDRLRDRFDTDWFHNPRAWAEICAGELRAPDDDPAPDTAQAVRALSNGFEEMLA